MTTRTQAMWLLWIEYLLAKADGNEVEAAEKLKLITEDLFP
jgi:hypothetical protein